MKKALATSGINDGKKGQLIQMGEAAIRKGIKVIGLDDESGQRVINRGTELFDAILDKMRELSLELPEMPFFGIADWQAFNGIVFTPKQIASVAKFPWSDAVLNAPCPFHHGKMVRETHFAFVGKEGMTIMELQQLFPQSGQPRFYSYAPDAWYSNQQFATKETLKFRWYLLLKDIVPGSENTTFEKQKAMLPKGYEVPSAAAETAKDLLVFKKIGIHANSNRYARTSSLDSDGDRVRVGFCDAGGVDVSARRDGDHGGGVGVGASRKFE